MIGNACTTLLRFYKATSAVKHDRVNDKRTLRLSLQRVIFTVKHVFKMKTVVVFLKILQGALATTTVMATITSKKQ